MYSSYPFDKWDIDKVGKLSKASGERSYIIVTVWAKAEVVAKIDEKIVQKFLWKNIFHRFGIPRILISDNDTQSMEPGYVVGVLR